MRYAYPARISQDEDGTYLIEFRDFPEAATDGETVEEALNEGRDLLRSALGFRAAEGEPIPEPSAAQPGERLVGVPVQMALKIAVITAFRTSGITKTDLARRLDIGENEARRLLDPWHTTKTDRLEQALIALGDTWRLEVNDLAA